MKRQPKILKNELLSPSAMKAFKLAEYKIRHNARYSSWSEDKCLQHKLLKAFDAAIKDRK